MDSVERQVWESDIIRHRESYMILLTQGEYISITAKIWDWRMNRNNGKIWHQWVLSCLVLLRARGLALTRDCRFPLTNCWMQKVDRKMDGEVWIDLMFLADFWGWLWSRYHSESHHGNEAWSGCRGPCRVWFARKSKGVGVWFMSFKSSHWYSFPVEKLMAMEYFTSGISYPSEESCWHLRSGLVAPWTFGSQDRVPSSWPTSLGRFDQKNPAKLGGFKKNLVSDEVKRGWSFRPSHPKWTSARTPYDSGDAGCNGPYAPGRVFNIWWIFIATYCKWL